MPGCTVPMAVDAAAAFSFFTSRCVKLGSVLPSVRWETTKINSYLCHGTPRHCCSASGLSPGCPRGSGSTRGALGLIWGPNGFGGGQISPFRGQDEHPAGKMGVCCVIMHEGKENGSIYRNSAFFSLLSAWLCRNIKSSLSV